MKEPREPTADNDTALVSVGDPHYCCVPWRWSEVEVQSVGFETPILNPRPFYARVGVKTSLASSS